MKPAPYAADTRAKGWRFELDLERVRQSDTWAIAPAEARPWLFMLWAESWLQTPCGSLPNDDALLCARLGMPAKLFAKHRAVLMRGWWLAEDGRMYHPTITELVMSMLRRKDAEKTRKAEYRARMDESRARKGQAVPPLSRGTGEGQDRDGAGIDGTGTGTSTGREDYGSTDPPSSARGAVGVALKAAGLDPMSFNLDDPRVAALIAAGATPEHWRGLAGEALKTGKTHPWAWVLAVLPDRLSAGKAIKPAGKHAGFATKDYRAGVTDDGYIAAQ